ncbi:hypothetical protein [Streptococcus equi]|uniref:hypothetical protein n=1 Tax=Streptococcus equi TaxID=1336 RepID=UPI001E56E787|nr:hypothetical protein [Streptococcus equi]
MTKMIYTLALVDDKNSLQNTFFTTLSQRFSYLFHITIVRQLTTEQLKKAQAIFTFQNLKPHYLYFILIRQTKSKDLPLVIIPLLIVSKL